MSYERLGPRIEELEAEVAAMLKEAEATDSAEDRAYGVDKRGDEIPKKLRRRETRIAKMRQAKAAIEAEATERAKAKHLERTKAKATTSDKAEASEKTEATVADDDPKGATSTDTDTAQTQIRPNPKAQRSFTDPDSRMMKTNDGFQFAYNAQAVVDEGSQVIVATKVT